ncbi:MAG TPA: ABC transporter permease [Puia sp.]|nr:ABC transporter permease [Puia sp.]
MLVNYYKTAIRSISRSRFHSLLNITGLSIGIAFFLLIGAFAWSEWRVNHDLRHADRQFFLESVWRNPSMGPGITTVAELAPALKTNYPSLVANYFRWDGITCTVSVGDRYFRAFAAVSDSTLFDMYGFRLLAGDPHTALDDPFTVVITAGEAQKVFGRTDVVGRDLLIASFAGTRHPFRITAVMADPPRNSVTGLIPGAVSTVFIPVVSQQFFGRNMGWQNIYIPSYVELQPGVKPEQLAGPIRHLIKVNASQFAADLTVKPRPLTEFYLAGAKPMVLTLLYIAVFILAMAVINFVNLSVGRSAARMKEIGVRKVLGGIRLQLIRQFLTESILLVVLASGLALLLYGACTPLFSGMLGKDLPPFRELPVALWCFLPLFVVLLGVVAGLYPAFVLSSLPSVESLKGKLASIRDRDLLRKGLVGFQFGIAIVALIGALIVSRQVALFFSDQLGFKKDFVVTAQVPRNWNLQGVQHMEQVRDGFTSLPGVKDAALSYETPNGNFSGIRNMFKLGEDSTHAVVVQQYIADEHYASVYQIPMAAGHFFNSDPMYNNDDSMRMVINESAARALGWKHPADAIGQKFRFAGFPQVFSIAGVIKDFHFDAMGAPISPAVFTHLGLAYAYRYLSFKLKPGNIPAEIAGLQNQWSKLLPGAPFDYEFMDETLSAVYSGELRIQKAADLSTVLSLVIVALGVIGLLTLSVQRRTKEIAIRKVVGSDVAGIIRLFLREYLPLLLAGGVVASPLAWWIMHRWLQNYATRITIGIWPFVEAAGCLAVVMIVLIVTQTFSAATANPVKALRSE